MIPDRPRDVVLTQANQVMIVELDLGSTYREHHFQVNGNPGIWVAPQRVRFHYARRDGASHWELTQLQVIGFPVLPTPASERHQHVERQRTYEVASAPAWLLELGEACRYELVRSELPSRRPGGAS